MSFDQVKDVLAQARQFYRYTAEYYQKLREKSDRQRVRMLLDYMARREKGFAEIVAEYQDSAADKITETWMQFTPPQAVTDYLESLETRPVQSVDELLKIAREIDQHLLDYYQTLVNTAPLPKIRAAFANLMNSTLQKEREVLFHAQRMRDL